MKKQYVIIQHALTGIGAKYLFLVPVSHKLLAGEYVLCDTRQGDNQIGVCVCDSFMAEPDVIMPLFNTKESKMRTVKAVLHAVQLLP